LIKRLFFVASAVSMLLGCDGRHSSLIPSAPSPVFQATPASLPPGVPLAVPLPLSGYVSDTAFRFIAGAKVEVIDGSHAGTVTTSDADGFFSYEQKSESLVTVRATKDGYAPSVATSVATSDGRAYVFLKLSSLTPPVGVAGNYTLTISADPACTALPDEVRTRTYVATVTAGSTRGPANTFFNGTLTGGQFYSNIFWVGVFGDYVTISTAGEGPSIVERVGPNRYVAFYGEAGAVARSGTSTVSASYKGSIEYCELKSAIVQSYDCAPALAAVHAECSSNNGLLTLTRR
jgi:hypothetical protein